MADLSLQPKTGSQQDIAQQTVATSRNWAALPRDGWYEIFCRHLQEDILNGAGLVCALWRHLAVEEPMLWRHIDIAFDWEEYAGVSYDEDEERFNLQETPAGLLAMAHAAVNRSAGRCMSFRGPVDGHLLVHLATNAPSLRSLHVTSFFRLQRGLADMVVPKMAMLERLVLTRGLISCTTLRVFLDHCPRLELLDAGGCYLGFFPSCHSRNSWACLSEVKVLTLPRKLPPEVGLYAFMQAEDYYY